MKFSLIKKFASSNELIFDENDAPSWLTGENTVRGSTMDGRWFWEQHVLKLNVGQSVETDFSVITRIE